MEAVLSQSAPLRNILVDGVRANMFGKSLVKRRIEICDIWDLWILLSTSPNDFKCAEIVSAKKKKKSPLHQWNSPDMDERGQPTAAPTPQ